MGRSRRVLDQSSVHAKGVQTGMQGLPACCAREPSGKNMQNSVASSRTVLMQCVSYHERCCLLHHSRLTLQVRLSNGMMMPSIGFGTAGLGEHTGQAVKEALLAGYALFDTAQVSILVTINL